MCCLVYTDSCNTFQMDALVSIRNHSKDVFKAIIVMPLTSGNTISQTDADDDTTFRHPDGMYVYDLYCFLVKMRNLQYFSLHLF